MTITMVLFHSGIVVLIVLGLGWPPVTQAQPSTQTDEALELEKLFEGDLEEQALRVNEGELKFLTTPPVDKTIHTVTNTITISESSLTTQWVTLHQCHKNLDAVAESQIVYQYRQMRNLRVEHYFGMETAWIENQSVQMKDVAKGATLCVLADVRILQPDNKGGYVLRNGPYFRKFLDGYYPFHVQLNIIYPKSCLILTKTEPKPQNGFEVLHTAGRLTMNAWFEGQLIVEARFSHVAAQ